MLKLFFKHNYKFLLQGKFGLEKENIRVTPDGELALTPHPAIFGNKAKNPFITTDFSESQVEMITPPMDSIPKVMEFIETLHDIVTEHIGSELLWPQSLPPLLPSDEQIPTAQYENEDKELEEYRNTIAKIYGKGRQLICGIHFNFSFTDECFEQIFKEKGERHSITQIKEEIYLKIVRGFMRHRWILVWLFGETPLAERNFRVLSLETGEQQPMKCGQGISLRTGPLGYRNKEEFVMDYYSIENYKKQILQFIEEGYIQNSKELYMPLRLKFLSEDKGAPSYLEIRLLDLDPLTKCGVSSSALYFTHLLLLYALLETESSPFNAEEQYKATRKQDYASCFGRCSEKKFPDGIGSAPTVVQEVRMLLDDMYHTLKEYKIWEDTTYLQQFEYAIHLAEQPDDRPGMIVYRASQNDNFIQFHMDRAYDYKKESLALAYRFHGLEDMEMSTQLLLRAAVCKGVRFSILDRSENFIKLYNEQLVQYVVQATKTALDNYATILVMENKVVTKEVLSYHHINVPRGSSYTHIDSAINDFLRYINRPIVIKPKSTNFGIGITILKNNTSIDDYRTALEIAFEKDNTILVEEFISGREFRFFVLNNEVVGVLHRIPANVIGDGAHTIRQLVEEKNKDPRRGKGYVSPLEVLRLGREEELFLRQQNMDFNSIPAHGVIVYLRENSNISTGGDSIDFTDEVNHSYKAIAVRAAQAVGAKITGVDMMILDIYEPAGEANYAIIEMNFNPAIHIHCFPYQGRNRHINYKLIQALGFMK